MLLPRAALLGLVSAALCLLLAVVVWWSTGHRDEAPAGPVPELTPADVVRDWDQRRAQAWAQGDVAALRDLYAPRAAVGRRDVAMLERYVERGLVVEGLTTQLVQVQEVRGDEETWVLDVADRVHAGTVVGQGVRRALPHDNADRRRLTLRRDAGVWRVVAAVALPATSGGQSS